MQTQANSGGMHFDISKTDVFQFPCKNVIPDKDSAPVTIDGHTIPNNVKQRWVGVWLTNNLRPQAHIAQRAAYASTRFYKLVPLLKRLVPEVASRLVKATVIPVLTFGLEIYTRAHVNKDKLAPMRICLRMAAQIITGGWKKSDFKALCAEAGLHSPLLLAKRVAMQASARMLSLLEEYPLTHKLPWKCPPKKTYLKKAKYITQIPEGTTNIAPPRARYLQLDGVTNHILPLIANPHHPERPSKKTINKFLKELTIKEFE